MDILPINGHITDLWIYYRSMDILPINGHITDQWIYHWSMDILLIYGYITDLWIYYWSMYISLIYGYITDQWNNYRTMDISLTYGYITDLKIYYRSMDILPINGYKISRRIVQLPVRSWRKPVPRFISKFWKRVSYDGDFKIQWNKLFWRQKINSAPFFLKIKTPKIVCIIWGSLSRDSFQNLENECRAMGSSGHKIVSILFRETKSVSPNSNISKTSYLGLNK